MASSMASTLLNTTQDSDEPYAPQIKEALRRVQRNGRGGGSR
ncbi:hypothetical protein ACWF9B_35470 [Streptomyces sp. NPDC055089]